MSNSPLVDYVKISPNKTVNRTAKIDRITPHCVVGQATVERLGDVFAPVEKEASANYGIGLDGRIGMYVEEKDRSWCSCSAENDHRAVTIECASDAFAPYAFKDVVYESLIELCADICRRNGKTKLLWFGDKNKTLSYKPKDDEMVLTVHRWFFNKSCPGNWMYSRMGDLAEKVTAKLCSGNDVGNVNKLYVVQAGSFREYKYAQDKVAKLKAAGFDAFITETEEKITFNIGDKVKLHNNAVTYGTSKRFSSWVYESALYIREISGDRVVISTAKTGPVTGAVNMKYLTKI